MTEGIVLSFELISMAVLIRRLSLSAIILYAGLNEKINLKITCILSTISQTFSSLAISHIFN